MAEIGDFIVRKTRGTPGNCEEPETPTARRLVPDRTPWQEPEETTALVPEEAEVR